MKPSRFLLAAEQELSAAATFYENRAPGLGQKFIASVERIVYNICCKPQHFPSLEGRIRRAIIHGFPYSILFINSPEEIAIVAVMHDRRQPYYWIQRT
jgi:plasmid stabilization system protein ParE